MLRQDTYTSYRPIQLTCVVLEKVSHGGEDVTMATSAELRDHLGSAGDVSQPSRRAAVLHSHAHSTHADGRSSGSRKPPGVAVHAMLRTSH
ncbi:unnamed protein product [Caenorhabditis auriculariae]|uniref:Uncharacterized protein n=1 Tax=Caenorhabditis auriculariae TaxID=2777116 RepID=A0A8S1H8X1_9PELO|nr:unnamed protein product [Caenorhabditis auriculariae]